jgi:hypothetical protein
VYKTHAWTRTRKRVICVYIFNSIYRTEIPTIIDPRATVNFPSATGLIIVGSSVQSRVHTNTYAWTCTHERVICVYIFNSIYIQSHVHTNTYAWTRTHERVSISVCIFSVAYTYNHMYMQTRMYVYTFPAAHTYIQANLYTYTVVARWSVACTSERTRTHGNMPTDSRMDRQTGLK